MSAPRTPHSGRFGTLALLAALACTSLPLCVSLSAQTPHDISQVDVAPPGGVIAVPIPQKRERQLRKYEIPELVGARQALGSQLIDGELPKPLIDYATRSGFLQQRISIFDGGLVVVALSGAGGTMQKKVLLPADALAAYRKAASPQLLATVRTNAVTPPENDRRSLLRLYRDDGTHVEVAFDPAGAIPKSLGDEIHPLEDLMRALSEDRTVTSTIAGYEPAVGDELVGDDRKTWRVERVTPSGIVELRCTSQPTVVYVDKKFLYNYFVGKKAGS